MGLTTLSWKNLIVQKPCKGCRTDLGRRPRKRNKYKDMVLATWNTQTQVDKRCGRRFKEALCETMQNESIG